MNYLFKSLLSIAALLVAGQAFADVNCLPSSVVANTALVKAVKDPSPQSKIWAVVSDKFVQDNNAWNVVFAITLPDTSNPADALEQAQARFKTIALKDAQPIVFGQQVFCQYASLENEYVVLAASPPLSVDISMNVARKLS